MRHAKRKRVLIVLAGLGLIAVVPLYANSIRYFHQSGLSGYFLAAIYAVEVWDLPEPVKVNVPAELQALTQDELKSFVGGPALRYIHPTRRELRRIVRFVSPNEYTSSSSVGPALDVGQGHYVLDRDLICSLASSGGTTVCYRLYKDKNGTLFRHVHPRQEFSAEWQPVVFYGN